MAGWQEFTGLNRGYVLELYKRYRRDPAAVDAETRALFERWTPPTELEPVPDGVPLQKVVGAVSLAQSIRMYGHLAARLDPLGNRDRRRRSVAPPGNPQRHRRGPAEPAGDADFLAARGFRGEHAGRHQRLPRGSTARRPATTTRMCSSRKSATGCGTRPRAGASVRRPIRSARSPSSTGSRRSRCSSGSCTACSRARRASRSKASTCWCRSSTR